MRCSPHLLLWLVAGSRGLCNFRILLSLPHFVHVMVHYNRKFSQTYVVLYSCHDSHHYKSMGLLTNGFYPYINGLSQTLNAKNYLVTHLRFVGSVVTADS